MRVIQLIDSLVPGGAERMAVNYANALSDKVDFSGLVSTRKEGDLKKQLHPKVAYLFLNRKSTLDLKAIFTLRRYVVDHQVTFVHAHSSSFLLAVMLKLTYPKMKIVWHDHNGNRVLNKGYYNRVIKLFSYLFNGVLTVNPELESWAKTNLKVFKVRYISNFAAKDRNEIKLTKLNGQDGKRVVCLANLKHPKNHLTLLKGFHQSELSLLGWSLHLIGNESDDAYAKQLKDYITNNHLEENIFIYGSCSDVFNILSQSTIGVLSSTYEGFPVALLEYGLSHLAVVSTNVGYCSEIINKKNGLLFDPNNQSLLEIALKRMAIDPLLREKTALNLNLLVTTHFSQEAVIIQVLEFYKELQ